LSYNYCEVFRQLLRIVEEDPVLREGFEKTIKPLLIDLRRASLEELIFRFVYTIVDQRRGVEEVVIPIWFAFRITGLDLNSLQRLNVDEVEEIFACLLQEYGHEQYYTQKDYDNLARELGTSIVSRASAIAKALQILLNFKEYSKKLVGVALDFAEFIRKYYKDLVINACLRRKFLNLFKLVGEKSLDFFLRDLYTEVTDIEAVPFPVDVHVAETSQLLGLYFTDDEIKTIVQGDFSPVFPLSDREKYAPEIKSRIVEKAEKCGYKPDDVKNLNRSLFLVGKYYCSQNKCNSQNRNKYSKCPVSKYCFLQQLLRIDPNKAQRFLHKILCGEQSE